MVMRDARAYGLLASLLIAVVAIGSAQVHLTADAVSEGIDRHLYGECRSKSAATGVWFCSFCKDEGPRRSDGLIWEFDDFGDSSSSAGFPSSEDFEEGPIDESH
jgi:hypothetical protein